MYMRDQETNLSHFVSIFAVMIVAANGHTVGAGNFDVICRTKAIIATLKKEEKPHNRHYEPD